MKLYDFLPQIAFSAAGSGGGGGGSSAPRTRPQARPDQTASTGGGGKGGTSNNSGPATRPSSSGGGGKGARQRDRANQRWEDSVIENPTEQQMVDAAPRGMTWDGTKYTRVGSTAPETSPVPQTRPDNIGVVSSPTTSTNTRSSSGPVNAPETVNPRDGVGGGRSGGAGRKQKAGKLNEANARINQLQEGADQYATGPQNGRGGARGGEANAATASARARGREAARAARERTRQRRNNMRIAKPGPQ